MANFSFTDSPKIDGVHWPLALYHNEYEAALEKLSGAALVADFANTETLSATKSLTDADKPIQNLSAGAANRDVNLPSAGAGNHLFEIRNSGGSNNLTVKSGGATLVVLRPGDSMVFISNGATWRTLGIIISEIDNSPRSSFGELLVPNGMLTAGGNGSVTFNPAAPDYITGLKLEWLAVNQVRVTTGAAYIQGTNEILRVGSAITVNYAAGSMIHYYLYNNAGTPAVEASLTAPAAPYFGTARSKTGDTSRRYIGSLAGINISGTNTVLNFLMVGNQIMYRVDSITFGRVVSNQNPTSETSVSCTTFVPPTARAAILRIFNSATAGLICTGTSDDAVSAPGTTGITLTGPGGTTVVAHPLDASQAFTYWYNTAPSGSTYAYVDVYGFILER